MGPENKEFPTFSDPQVFLTQIVGVGVNLELRFKKLPSILNIDKSVETNFNVLCCKLTPTEVKKFLTRFSEFFVFYDLFFACHDFV